MANNSKIDSENKFKILLKNRGLKYTPERKSIFDQVSSIDCHFDAKELIFKLRQKKNRVSRGSVYRTLNLLEEMNIIRPVVFTDRHTHYEVLLGRTHHSHLICTGCNKVIEFSNKSVLDALRSTYKDYGFKERDHRIEITGLCKKCQRKNT